MINAVKEKKQVSDIYEALNKYAISSFSRKPGILVER